MTTDPQQTPFNPVHDINQKNIVNSSVRDITSIPYDPNNVNNQYNADGWYQDEYGEWYQDPDMTKQPQSQYIVSDSNQNDPHINFQDGGKKKPDNYEEGWYQDEYGEWLNEFDWHQDEYGEWYYEDSYDYEAGWLGDG